MFSFKERGEPGAFIENFKAVVSDMQPKKCCLVLCHGKCRRKAFKNCAVKRCGGLMVSSLDSGASDMGSSPGRGHCFAFLGKTLYSHIASLYPGV